MLLRRAARKLAVSSRVSTRNIVSSHKVALPSSYLFVASSRLRAVAPTRHSSVRSYSQMSASSIPEFIDEQIKTHPVVIFSKSWCPYCNKVKKLFKDINVTVHVIELDQRSDGDDIQRALAAKTGQRTVPSVFIGQKHVGGSDDTHAAKSNGKLKKMLDEAGVASKL